MKIKYILLGFVSLLFFTGCSFSFGDFVKKTPTTVTVSESAGGYTFKMPLGWQEVPPAEDDYSSSPDVAVYTSVNNPSIHGGVAAMVVVVKNADNAEDAFEKYTKSVGWKKAIVVSSREFLSESGIPSSFVYINLADKYKFDVPVFNIRSGTYAILRRMYSETLTDEEIMQAKALGGEDYQEYLQTIEGYEIIISTFQKL